MRIQNPKRTFFIGIIVWLLFFGWWFRGFLFKNWQFRLFSFKSWKYLINEFRSGWYISSKSDWIFLFSFILAPFIFALLWLWAQKIQWRKIWKKIWNALRWPFLQKKKRALKEATAAYEPKGPIVVPVYRPQEMPSSGARFQPLKQQPQKTFLNASTAMGDFQTEMPQSAPKNQGFDAFPNEPAYPMDSPEPISKTFTNDDFEKMAQTPISEIEIPKMEPADEDIGAILTEAGYTLLPVSAIAGQKIDFVAASQNELVLALCDTEAGDWLADEESFNDEDPLWFSETDHRVSPVFQLISVSKTVQKNLGDAIKVQPVLIEREGTIINAEDMMRTWNDLGVKVCRTKTGGPVELPTGSEIFKESQEKISDELLEKIKAVL